MLSDPRICVNVQQTNAWKHPAKVIHPRDFQHSCCCLISRRSNGKVRCWVGNTFTGWMFHCHFCCKRWLKNRNTKAFRFMVFARAQRNRAFLSIQQPFSQHQHFSPWFEVETMETIEFETFEDGCSEQPIKHYMQLSLTTWDMLGRGGIQFGV